MKHGREVAYEIAEIHSALRRERKDDFAPVKRKLAVNELHGKIARSDLLFTDAHCLSAARFSGGNGFLVLLGRDTDDVFKRLHDRFLRNFP